jgi:HD-GYP domain-containing protein (c-di-GMP phosphodiesterase class II)
MTDGARNGVSAGRRHPLERFVHRTLLLRLAAAALAMAAVTSLAVVLLERDRVSGQAVAYALDSARIFHARYGGLYADPARVDAAALREAFLDFRRNATRSSLGEFASFRLWRADGTLLAELFMEEYELASAVRAEVARESAPPAAAAGRADSRTVRVGGRPHLRITFPVEDPSGRTIGVADGLFAFSPGTIRAFRRDGVRAGLWIAVTVMLTAAILYPVLLHLARRIVRFSVRLLEANLDTLETLGNAIAQRDSDTNAHNYRVTILSARIGEELGLPAADMRTLIKGAFLHDVGKIGIPDRILLKPGRLDDEEFEQMKTHVEHGRAILGRSSWLQDALNVVLFHHETVAGKGYPRGVSGEEIPVTARIFAIADVFDALTSKRPYKNPFSFDQAMKILEEGRGTHFDPKVLDVFSRIARPLYERFEGKDAVPREELAGIMRTWFRDEMESLEY